MLLEQYNPIWITDYKKIKEIINQNLQQISISIEHVGSTAVPNLDSKPIIDIDIIYSNQADFNVIKKELEILGYYHNGNQGILEREVFKRSNLHFNEVLDTIKHHLYVCPIGSKALERHILTRNYLQKNEWARNKYQSMKYHLANMANQDKKEYAALKEQHINSFLDQIIAEEK